MKGGTEGPALLRATREGKRRREKEFNCAETADEGGWREREFVSSILKISHLDYAYRMCMYIMGVGPEPEGLPTKYQLGIVDLSMQRN